MLPLVPYSFSVDVFLFMVIGALSHKAVEEREEDSYSRTDTTSAACAHTAIAKSRIDHWDEPVVAALAPP